MRTDRRETSFEVDFVKVDQAKQLLGMSTLTDTIDAALNEVIALEQRRQLVDLLYHSSELDLGDETVMAKAWR